VTTHFLDSMIAPFIEEQSHVWKHGKL